MNGVPSKEIHYGRMYFWGGHLNTYHTARISPPTTAERTVQGGNGHFAVILLEKTKPDREVRRTGSTMVLT